MKTVAIVGSAKTTRHLAPFDNPEITIWGINEALAFPWMKRADAMFQMHARGSFTRANNHNDPNHWAWLQQPHPFPIYMQQVWPDVPASVAYPLHAVVQHFGRQYFTSTVAYMIALAMLQDFERIELYGVEQSSDTEYYWQRDCTSYWLGVAEGAGYEVYMPAQCSLLTGKLYGYEGGTVIERQFIEARKDKLTILEAEASARVNEAGGRMRQLADMLEKEPHAKRRQALEAQFNQVMADERAALIQAATISGARQETETYLLEIDKLLRAAGAVAGSGEYSHGQ